MPTLQSLAQAEKTTRSLHNAAKILSSLRMVHLQHHPLYLEQGLFPTPSGLTSGVLPSGAEVFLDFNRVAMVYHAPEGYEMVIPLVGETQVSAAQKLFEVGKFGEVAEVDAALRAKFTEIPRDYIGFDFETPFSIDPTVSRHFGEALYAITTGIALFKSRLTGAMTPIIVWPGGFDLSTLIFTGTALDESQFHLNFGFAPYSRGIDYPYVYAYTHPTPEGLTTRTLPSPAHWHTEGWTGVVIPYEEIAKHNDPVNFTMELCERVYHVLVG
jgi:hypothetical protein